ncbi:sugar-binding transcriptional regulator [Roseinatronobacter alkalisoli]|uniref:Sugar-binding domain-containing protein n=1 Tax=Roseinatronobacter alkalisoli TaxID=3028235 RepID=A0ABT5TAP9_9RHOB|nr:sugar-binding domain-containing protein [Roseinatronobacter sp. HJB301]MDD7972019.1 sugar-binding domain-containing protein [Roseinatronobacter sp. HJB301]
MKRAKPGKLLNRRMMHTAAKLHYLQGLSQVEVSRRMDISTATTSRLLGLAREEGIVRIRVLDLDEFDGLSDKLAEALRLKSVRVTESGKAAALSTQVGTLLDEAKLAPGSVVAIGWGRTIQSIISAGLPKLPEVEVVPMTGGMHEAASHFQINEFVRMAAEQTGGAARFLYAPFMVSPELHSVLIRDPRTAQVIELWARVEAAIVGIGAYVRDGIQTEVGFSEDEVERVVGDVIRHYFDSQGREIRWPGQENQMSIARAQLERIPLSIGVAMGREKAMSIIGAARSGMINSLVTDTATASEILGLLEESEDI